MLAALAEAALKRAVDGCSGRAAGFGCILALFDFPVQLGENVSIGLVVQLVHVD